MALKAKRALDDVEASMRPDTSRRAEREAGGRVEQVKLLRSEFAAIKSVQSQFSRTLFVSNLPNVPPPAPCMHPAYILHVLCFSGRACGVSPYLDNLTIVSSRACATPLWACMPITNRLDFIMCIMES
jgi:hypothetical protein